MNALSAAPDAFTDVIGFGFAINGKMNNVDIYASRQLFTKLWKKNLLGAAMESVALLDEPAESKTDIAGVIRFLSESETGEKTEKTVDEHIKIQTADSEKKARFTTRWSAGEKAPCCEIHENIIHK